MENASKALIIAGAILLAIIIISLGIMVVNNARNQIGGANLNAQEVQAFNSNWESYIGDKKTAAEVKALCSAVIANNATEKASGTARYIEIAGNATATGAIATSSKLSVKETGAATGGTTTKVPAFSNLKTYTVEIDGSSGYTNGYISKINVKDN